MRSFLAMIRNSFYEAVDNKIFVVLVGFSLLFTVLILLIGFEELPFEETVRGIFRNVEAHFKPVARFGSAPASETGGSPPELLDVSKVERDGKTWYRAEFTVKDPEKFRLKVPPLPGMPEWGASYEGEGGIMACLQFESRMAGFFQVRTGSMGDGRYFLEAKPGKTFETAGAQQITILFGVWKIPLRGVTSMQLVFGIESMLAKFIGGWIGVIVAIIVTSWFVPEMMAKGTIDLLLSKPVARVNIIASKYVGGLLFVFLNASVLVGGTWFAFSLKSGFWHAGYLGSVLTITLLFAVLYSVSVLAAVLWRNSILCIAASILFWVLCFLVNLANSFVNRMSGMFTEAPDWLRTGVKVIYRILPSTSDIGDLSDYFMSLGTPPVGMSAETNAKMFEKIDFAGSIVQACVFIAVMLLASYVVFRRKDF